MYKIGIFIGDTANSHPSVYRYPRGIDTKLSIKLSVLCNTVCVPGLFLVSDLDAKREVKYEEVSVFCTHIALCPAHMLHSMGVCM